MWNIRNIKLIPVKLGALDSISKKLANLIQ